MLNAFINIIKPEGMNSTRAVNLVKKKLKMLPCGHMGTLDPMASGVLPIGINKATRLFDYLLDKQKTYVAEFKFGEERDTLDITGRIVSQNQIVPTFSQIEQVLPQFVGKIEQYPPKFSSKYVNGVRAYTLSRRGKEFELPPKTVEILSLKLNEQVNENTFRFTIVCKGGTYVRSICRDIASKLNTVAVMTKLNRTQSGIFIEQNGVTVSEFLDSDNIEKYLIKPDQVIDFKKIVLDKKTSTKILNGVFDNLGYEDGYYRVYSQTENDFWGVGISKDGVLKIKSYVRDNG